jgi:shikimate kinase
VARLVLVGLPGAGKTTLAHALADAWGCPVVDTDDVLTTLVGVPAAQYLRERGEPAFRERELEALHAALLDDAVVSTGAGIVTTADARASLERENTLWLDSDDDTLLARVGGGDRPLLGDDHRVALAALREQRGAWYAAVSRSRVDTTGSLEDVIERVINQAKIVAS